MAKVWRWEDVWRSVRTGPLPLRREDGPNLPSDEHAAAFRAKSRLAGQRPTNVRLALQEEDPKRWRRLQSDLAWVELRLGEMGLNPDDARWYL